MIDIQSISEIRQSISHLKGQEFKKAKDELMFQRKVARNKYWNEIYKLKHPVPPKPKPKKASIIRQRLVRAGIIEE